MVWRWISTPLSADRGEVSILAIVETIIAISISLGIAWYWQTLTHIAVSACLAPFLLLRSRRSVLLAMFALGALFDKRTELSRKYRKESASKLGMFKSLIDWFLGAAALFSIFVFPIISRIYAIFWQLFIQPLGTIERIPTNWYRVIFCVDWGNLPEYVPGTERFLKREIYLIWNMNVNYFDRFAFSRISKSPFEKFLLNIIRLPVF